MIEYEVYDFSANGPNRGLLIARPDGVLSAPVVEQAPAPQGPEPVTQVPVAGVPPGRQIRVQNVQSEVLAALATGPKSARELQACIGRSHASVATVASNLRSAGVIGFTPRLVHHSILRAQGRYWLKRQS